MERQLLAKLRNKKGLTQEQLAERLDISAIYVRKLEKGAVNPGRKTMIKYENYFKVSMKRLFPDLFFENDDTKLISDKEVS